MYSTSDPTPPKHSSRFCFKLPEEKKFFTLASIFNEVEGEGFRGCIHNTVRDLFLKGKNYRETSQYRRMIQCVDEGTILYGCRSEEDVDRYFSDLDHAFQSIKEEGYKSQRELGKFDEDGFRPIDEVRIHVTGEGRLCLGSKGNHRLRIAEILGVPQIPCHVYGVNLEWLIALSRDAKLPPDEALLNWMQAQSSVLAEDEQEEGS